MEFTQRRNKSTSVKHHRTKQFSYVGCPSIFISQNIILFDRAIDKQPIFEKIGGLDGIWIYMSAKFTGRSARFRLNFALTRGGGCAFGTAQEALPSSEQNKFEIGLPIRGTFN